MYTPGAIKLAVSFATARSDPSITSPKPQYTTPRRMMGTRREIYGEGRRSRTVGMVSRNLFG